MVPKDFPGEVSPFHTGLTRYGNRYLRNLDNTVAKNKSGHEITRKRPNNCTLKMNIFIILGLILFLPLLLFAAYLLLSSCLGDSFRARISGVPVNIRQTTYGQTYARNIGSATGQGGWEQIEMEDMMEPIVREEPELRFNHMRGRFMTD